MRRHVKQRYQRAMGVIAIWLTALVLGGLICTLCGCTRTVYVPAESKALQSDTVWQMRFKTDTLMMRDSVAVMQRGDTVYMTKYRDRYRVRELRDTVYRSLIDSVRVEVPYPVEAKLTAWQRMKMSLGGVAMAVILVALCAAVLWLVKRRGMIKI